MLFPNRQHCFQIDNMDKFIFVHKNYPPDPWVGYLKSMDFALACEVDLELIIELEVEFEDEVEGEDFSCVEVLGAKLKMMT